MDINMIDSPKTLDWQLTLKMANNETDWAKHMLTLLAEELPDTKTQLQNAAMQQNYDKIARLVHKLYGACCYCGVPKLKQLVEQFKTLVNSQQPETLEKYTLQLTNEIEAVIQAVKADDFWQA